MVGSHKILTVSYGTFSCTLEGFEDSFGTMRAIAEYFRDLAADDRYFGAEPPVPDAEMLARIAEREVSRRVEARMDGTGIVLRAGTALTRGTATTEEAEPSAAEAPAEAVAAPAAAPVMEADVEVAAEAPRPAPRPVMPTAVAPPLPPPADMADRLERIRAVVGRAPSEPAMAAAAPSSDEMDPDVRDLIALDLAAPEAVVPEPVASEPDDASTSALAAVEAVAPDEAAAFDDFPEALAASAVEAPEEAPVDAPIGAVAMVEAASGAATFDDPAADPSLGAVPAAPVRPRVIRMRRADFEQAVTSGALVEEEADAPEAMIDAVAPDAVAMTEAATTEAEMTEAGTLSAEAEADLLAELAVLEAERGDAEEAPALAATAGGDGVSEQVVAEEVVAADGTEAQDAIDVEAREDEPLEVEAYEVEAYEVEVTVTTVTETVQAASVADGTDAARAVGDLMASLGLGPRVAAPVEAPVAEEAGLAEDLDDGDGPEGRDNLFAAEAGMPPDAVAAHGPEDEAPTEAIEAAPRHAALPATPDADEASMARIMSQTDAHLAEPESSRRREAIAQLKAAVAATEAARRMGEAPPDAGLRLDPFRDDLRQAVRPRRPVLSQEGERDERPRPAPLKLVPSQRVDVVVLEAPRAVQAIRPRRVMTEASASMSASAPRAAATDDHGGFKAFADEMGAASLTDVLEAAAAYVAFVEGADDFSRPQIIDKVRQVATSGFSREDGLRSFGMLLRQGRITRVRGGRFQVHGDTRFHPGRRAV